MRRRRRIGLGWVDRPENGTDPSRLAGRFLFLTLLAQRARTAVTDACSIQQAQGAVPFESALLRVEGMTSRTAQRSIRLERKICACKSFRVRLTGPLRRSIRDCFNSLGSLDSLRKLMCLRRLGSLRRSKFCQAHTAGRQMLPELQAEIPDPLAQDLPAFLPTASMRAPAVRILLFILIGQDGLKRPSVQVEVKHIGTGECLWWRGGEKEFIDRL